jgi:hypothetical protein
MTSPRSCSRRTCDDARLSPLPPSGPPVRSRCSIASRPVHARAVCVNCVHRNWGSHGNTVASVGRMREAPSGPRGRRRGAQGGKVDTLLSLLEKGAKVDLQTIDGWTALMFAALFGHVEVVKVRLRLPKRRVGPSTGRCLLPAENCAGVG